MICPECNAENKESNKFCYSCGKELVVFGCSDNQLTNQTKNQNASQITNAEAELPSTSSPKANSVINKTFRIILALLACFGIFIIHTLIGVALGWKHGGGAIPMLIMLACMGFTWRAITGAKREK